jgi:inner membrane protein COX18
LFPEIHSVSDVLRIPLEYLHDTLHLPWMWVIPLAALTIRAALFYPITLSARQALQRRLAISPLISAHKPWFRAEARLAARKNPADSMMVAYQASIRRLTDELKTQYRCGLDKTFLRPLLQFPVFVGMSWTIQDMIGMKDGALRTLFTTLFGSSDAISSEPVHEAAVATFSAMAQDGLPWAVDLAAADPTGVLSYTVGAIMLSQVVLSMRSIPGGTNMLSRFLIVLSLAIGPVMVNAPAGILYYWACSSGLALLTNVWLDWRYPLVRFAPCKRVLLNNGLLLNKR